MSEPGSVVIRSIGGLPGGDVGNVLSYMVRLPVSGIGEG